MPIRKRTTITSLRPTAKVARPRRTTRIVRKANRRSKPIRKVFNDKSLFGALPGMSKWALPLLKQLRDE